MTAVAFRESTKPLLRARQIDALQREVRSLEQTLNAPPHIGNAVQNRGTLAKRLRRIKTQLETGAPRPYAPQERDSAMARKRELEDTIRGRMPTQEEMRRNPPGAVDKHIAHSRATKDAQLEWKNIRMRELATEADGGPLPDVRDQANIEMLRPSDPRADFSGAQINRPTIMIPDSNVPATVFTDAEIAWLRANEPEIAMQLVRLTNEQRAELKQIFAASQALPKQPKAPKVEKPGPKPKRVMSVEELEKRRAALAKGRATAAANRAAAKTEGGDAG